MKRWNRAKSRYEPYVHPIEWRCLIYSEWMPPDVNCAACGELVSTYETELSTEIYDDYARPYVICRGCKEKEKN